MYEGWAKSLRNIIIPVIDTRLIRNFPKTCKIMIWVYRCNLNLIVYTLYITFNIIFTPGARQIFNILNNKYTDILIKIMLENPLFFYVYLNNVISKGTCTLWWHIHCSWAIVTEILMHTSHLQRLKWDCHHISKHWQQLNSACCEAIWHPKRCEN